MISVSKVDISRVWFVSPNFWRQVAEGRVGEEKVRTENSSASGLSPTPPKATWKCCCLAIHSKPTKFWASTWIWAWGHLILHLIAESVARFLSPSLQGYLSLQPALKQPERSQAPTRSQCLILRILNYFSMNKNEATGPIVIFNIVLKQFNSTRANRFVKSLFKKKMSTPIPYLDWASFWAP